MMHESTNINHSDLYFCILFSSFLVFPLNVCFAFVLMCQGNSYRVWRPKLHERHWWV